LGNKEERNYKDYTVGVKRACFGLGGKPRDYKQLPYQKWLEIQEVKVNAQAIEWDMKQKEDNMEALTQRFKWNGLKFKAQNRLIYSAIYDNDNDFLVLANDSEWRQADEVYGLKLIFGTCKHLVTPNRDLKAVVKIVLEGTLLGIQTSHVLNGDELKLSGESLVSGYELSKIYYELALIEPEDNNVWATMPQRFDSSKLIAATKEGRAISNEKQLKNILEPHLSLATNEEEIKLLMSDQHPKIERGLAAFALYLVDTIKHDYGDVVRWTPLEDSDHEPNGEDSLGLESFVEEPWPIMANMTDVLTKDNFVKLIGELIEDKDEFYDAEGLDSRIKPCVYAGLNDLYKEKTKTLEAIKSAFQILRKAGVLNFVNPVVVRDFDFETEISSFYPIWLTKKGTTLCQNPLLAPEYGISHMRGFLNEIILDKREKGKKRKERTDSDIEYWEGKITKNDGYLVMPGLYHFDRRVRARTGSAGFLSSKDCWVIKDDEADLVSAIGKVEIPVGMNKVDLKSSYGLIEKDELAPVEIEVSDGGYVRTVRIDEWGEGAKPYVDNRSFREKLGINGLKGVMAIVFFLHVFLAMELSNRMSSKANSFFFLLVFGGSFYLPYLILGGGRGFEELVQVALSLYLMAAGLPIFYNSKLSDS
jgi:hypothetical protein